MSRKSGKMRARQSDHNDGNDGNDGNSGRFIALINQRFRIAPLTVAVSSTSAHRKQEKIKIVAKKMKSGAREISTPKVSHLNGKRTSDSRLIDDQQWTILQL